MCDYEWLQVTYELKIWNRDTESMTVVSEYLKWVTKTLSVRSYGVEFELGEVRHFKGNWICFTKPTGKKIISSCAGNIKGNKVIYIGVIRKRKRSLTLV